MAADPTAVPPGSDSEPEVGAILLMRGNGPGFSGSQTRAAIIGNRAIDNRAAIDAFPCIEDEKEIREPF